MYHLEKEKSWWAKLKLLKEREFILLVASELGIIAELNPERLNNRFAPSLIVDGGKAFLRCQFVPRFTSVKDAGIPPRFAVHFDTQGLWAMTKYYKDASVVFFVDWVFTEGEVLGEKHKVAPFSGVFRCSIGQVKKWCDAQPKKRYALFDVRWMEEISRY